VVASIVVVNVVAGGMRSITFVQAFQFWLKLTAIALPAMFLLVAWNADGAPDPSRAGAVTTRQATDVAIVDDTTITVESPTSLRMTGELDAASVDGAVVLRPGTHELGAGSRLRIPAGEPVPHVASIRSSTGADWVSASSDAGGRDYALYRVYSLLLALLFGTMGLPHVLVRFYTNPDGRTARVTTLAVLPLLGLFYLFPPVYAALGRVYTPDLLLTGRTDAVVLLLPARLVGGTLGELLTALVVAGAFAAFLSTSSGLTVSVAGVLSQDLMRGRWRSSVRGFRAGAALAVVLPFLISLASLQVAIADMVGLAFAVAASTLCPLLVLGIWWRGLTRRGAAVGLAVGGVLATGAVLATIAGGTGSAFADALLAQPAAWTVPVAFLVMILVSLATPSSRPANVSRTLVRLHAPEGLQLADRPAGPM
jgi:Na+(H+)/acetate symporter ActP